MPNHLLKVDLASESEQKAGADGCVFLLVYMASTLSKIAVHTGILVFNQTPAFFNVSP